MLLTQTKIRIDHPTINQLEQIEYVAKNCGDFLVANNKMIYYLCCSVFSKTSFTISIENKVVAFLFAFPDSDNEFIWLHQIAVLEDVENNKRYGGILFKNFLELIFNMHYTAVRFAIRKDNLNPLNLIFKMDGKVAFGHLLSINSLGLENNINPNSPMEIFELTKDKIY
jgi:hypothetical protein